MTTVPDPPCPDCGGRGGEYERYEDPERGIDGGILRYCGCTDGRELQRYHEAREVKTMRGP